MRSEAPLLERDHELAVVAGLVDAARAGEGTALVIEGPAGIGKTRLLASTCRSAADRQLTVLRARGGELEQGTPYGLVRELFAAPLAQHGSEELLAGPAALAAPVVAGSGEIAVGGGPHGLYWLTVNLADRTPLVLAVDDVHWADEASLRFLGYLARRLDGLPVLLVLAARTGEPGGDRPTVAALLDDPLATVLRPAPLSEAAAAAVVRAAFSPHADDALCHECRTATGGNPLLLRMLARALVDDGVAPHAAVPRVAELAPQVVAAAVLPRLRRLPADATTLAGAVAVLGDGAPLRHAAALAGLDHGAAARAADVLTSAGILAPGRPLEFVHPTVRRAVHDSLPPAEHHRAHRAAAEVLYADGAAADRVAAHLVVVEPLGDGRVVAILRDAARQARARGAVEEAVRYLLRAVDEPPEPALRAEVLHELGSAAALTRTSESYGYLRAALELAPDAHQRAEIALELARVLGVARDTRATLAVLDSALADIGPADSPLRTRLEAEYVSVARRFPATRAEANRRLGALADRADPHSLAGCVLLANLAADALEERSDAAEATRLAEAALRDDRLVTGGEADVALMASAVLMSTDRLDVAVRTWDAEAARAVRTGSPVQFGYAVTVRACLAYRRGRLADAEADAQLGDDTLVEHGIVLARRYSLAFLVGALVERGEVAEAVRKFDPAVKVNLTLLLDSRARLRHEQGCFAEAAADFVECGRRLAARGTRHAGMLAWRSGAALALARLGEDAEALRLAEEELELARTLGVPRALGIALRTVGLLRGRRGLPLLADAAASLSRSEARLEEAKALAELGAALRRANRRADARDPLRRALDLAVRCGAAPVADLARAELRAMGVRPRRAERGVSALTPSELRVARMAADGLGNRAIAQALFVTVKTVEIHLSSCYRKLAVPSRAELPAALDD
ncbi:MAG TPA: AAA family ATPase [Pseudonocardia sp.]|nr:AAA family ATPase [Pseudonocardia sp.]